MTNLIFSYESILIFPILLKVRLRLGSLQSSGVNQLLKGSETHTYILYMDVKQHWFWAGRGMVLPLFGENFRATDSYELSVRSTQLLM